MPERDSLAPLAPMLRPGDFIWHRFGSRGKQLAQVSRVTPAGVVYAYRFAANRRHWTRHDYATSPLRFATFGEVQLLRADTTAPIKEGTQ